MPTTIEPQFRIVPLRELWESPMNNRRHYDEKKLAELTDSVRTKGVLTPLLARPNSGNDKLHAIYEIAAGHRRYRAAKAAGVETVPVMIRDMSDAEFLEVLTIENLQREDIHPLDEALGYRELLDKHGYTAEVIAERVGKSTEYVYGRMKLADLIPEIQVRFLEDKITAGHAILLARLPEHSQVTAAKELFNEIRLEDEDGKWKSEKILVSVRELQTWIQQNIQMDLARAPFDTGDADLVRQAGACIACPKRTGAEPKLWPEAGKRDLCTDRVCYQKKLNAFIEDQVTSGQMVRLSDDWSDRDKKGVYYSSNVAEVAKNAKKCDDTTTGIFVNGHRRGQTRQICPNKSCKVHYGRGGSVDSGYRAPKPSAAEQLETAKRNITASLEAEFRKKVYEATAQKLELLGTDLGKLTKKPALILTLRLIYDRLDSSVRKAVTADLGLRKEQYSNYARASEVEKLGEKMDAGRLMALVIRLGLKNLAMGFTSGWSQESKTATEELVEIAAAFGVKVDPLKAEVDALKKEKLAKAKARIGSAKSETKAKAKKKPTVQTSAKSKAAPDPDDVDDDLDSEEGDLGE